MKNLNLNYDGCEGPPENCEMIKEMVGGGCLSGCTEGEVEGLMQGAPFWPC